MALTNMCTKYLGKTDPSCADPEGGDRVPGNHNAIGSLALLVRNPWKSTKLSSQQPLLGHTCIKISQSSLLSSTKEKLSELDPL